MANPAFRSSTSLAYAARTNSVVTAPAGLVDNDILLCILTVLSTAVGAPTPPVTPPAGFAQIATSPIDIHDNVNTHATTYIYWKRASSESGSYTFTHASSIATEAAMLAISGATTSGNPVDVTAGVGHDTGANGFTATNPGVTTTVANDLLLYIVSDWDGPPKSPPAGYTEIFDVTVIEVATLNLGAPGATGSTTQAVNVDDLSPWATFTVAIASTPVATATVLYSLNSVW